MLALDVMNFTTTLSTIVDLSLSAAGVLLAVPVAVILTQTVVASLGRKRPWQGGSPIPFPGRPPIGIIVPAHNESSAVGKTIASIRSQLSAVDRLLVVADNCTDDTAAQAIAHGAEVVERHDLELRGTGYALDHGWRKLVDEGEFALFLCVDAECVVHPGAVNELARTALKTRRPAQALYLIVNESVTSVRQRISAFAYIVSNLVRPVGFARLGLPCQLVGSGMMFPRACLEETSLASGHLVEDLLLGLTLTSRRHAPIFCDTAFVSSTFPHDKAAQEAQRTRWEHGRLSIITQLVPTLLLKSVLRLNFPLFAQTLDAAVPPLTLLLALDIALVALSGVFLALGGQPAPLLISGTAFVALFASLILAWARFGRDRLSGRDLLQASFYILWKLPLYARFVFARQTEWVRTKRNSTKP